MPQQNNENAPNIFSKVYYTISDISKSTGLPTSTIRYWEGEFKQIQPMRVHGNRRVYTINDLNIIKLIQKLLHVDNLSIEEVKTKLKSLKKKELIQNTIDKSDLIKRINNSIDEIDNLINKIMAQA